METRKQADSGSSSDNSNMTSLWKVLWGLQIPNKVKHFAWGVCKNILSTLSNLKRRGIVGSNLCEDVGWAVNHQDMYFGAVSVLLILGPLHQFSAGSTICILMTLWNCFGFWCMCREVIMMCSHWL